MAATPPTNHPDSPPDPGPPPSGKRWRLHRGRHYAVSLAHPAADLFPWPSEAETDAMAAEMADPLVGQKLPVRHLPDGRVLDGRSRELAALVAGVNPRYEVARLTEAEVPGFVLSLNCTRRHLEPGQRAMIAAGLANMGRGRPVNASREAITPVTQEAAAERLDVSRASVQRAAVVVRDGTPELADAVRAGILDVNTAARVTKLPAADQRAVSEAPDPKAAARLRLAATVRCPLLEPDRDVHWATGRCTVCDGRNAITEAEFEELPDELKEHARKAAAGEVGPSPVEVPPPHPFADLMAKATGLARQFTLAINRPGGERLKEYLSHLGLVEHQDKIIDGRKYGPRFVLLRGLRHVVELAGRPGPKLTAGQVRSAFDDDNEAYRS